MFIENYKCALHVSDALCVHLHKICRWYSDDLQHRIYQPWNNPPAHQQDTPQPTVYTFTRTQKTYNKFSLWLYCWRCRKRI